MDVTTSLNAYALWRRIQLVARKISLPREHGSETELE